ncbi:hypothetical protein EDM22_00025 [Agromyces tardus]|uniref:Cyclic nucleotide-binding domain-containing protein n=1 Tax=Agromyces tardus TaxID=2583849 RepID=A0A3M8ANT2_9MICO|nr:mechanosensitive ion channel domain-containing protein [Agromyces tardus]RNB52155.1 hypothetical protein EDM22_00025 [Agromyces tardus]
MNIVDQPWFWPTVAVVVGLPIAIVVLSECIVLLDRRGSRAARVLAMVRDWVLPTGALLILLGQVEDPQLELSWGRIVATVFGIVVILVIVNAINHLMFTRAAKGTWRERLPSIFIDIARIAVVVVGVGLLMSWVWDADVGGLFAALGVTSIIVGLALQHAVGGVISGLLLLFEQPFEQGEWIDTGDVRGRVVEVNWRSVHLATGDGMRVVPNAVLADASFTNLSRTAGPQFAEATVEFDPADPPNTVKRLLVETAADLPDLPADAVPEAAMEGGGAYTVSIPVHSPGDRSSTLEAFRTRLWYSARRAGLTLSGVGPVDENAAAELAAALRSEASVLNLDASSAEALGGSARLERYAAGETIHARGVVPDALRIVVQGRVAVRAAPAADTGELLLFELGRHDAFGLTAIMQRALDASVAAATDVTVLVLPAEVAQTLVHDDPELAREFGEELEHRMHRARAAFATAGFEPPVALRVTG